MYLEFVFLGLDGVFQLVQTLLTEDLYDDKYKGAKRLAGNGNYEGDIVDDGNMTVVTGRGICRFDGDNSYEGDWFNDLKTGRGVFRFGEGQWEGDTYTGDWVNDKMTGRGVYRWANGGSYEGDFRDDKMATGQMLLADLNLNLNLAAEFSGGDTVVDGGYRTLSSNPQGSKWLCL
jgi:hypothetical protein